MHNSCGAKIYSITLPELVDLFELLIHKELA